MTARTVTTQAELDAALASDFTGQIWIDSPRHLEIVLSDTRDKWVGVTGSATVERVTGSATVERVTGCATVERVTGCATVEWVDGSATVEWVDGSATVKWVDGSATVERVTGCATVERVTGSATVERVDGSATVKWVTGCATVERVDGSATVERVDGSATVERVDGSAIIHRLDGDATVNHAGSWVTVYLYSARATVVGGRVVDLTELDLSDPQTWCEFHGVILDGGRATVYKGVNAALTSGYGMPYPVGQTVTAPDWRATAECGHGLHFSPSPMATQDYCTPERYLECTVDLAEMVVLNDKVKARSCRVVCEVDRFGGPVPVEAVTS